MPSFTWKFVQNVCAREGCRNYLELTESVFYYCKTAAGKLATVSPWSFPWRRLIKRSNTATFKLTKIFAVIRLIHKHLSSFYCRKRIFCRGTKTHIASEEALSNNWLNRCRRKRFSTNRNLLSRIERTRKVEKIANGTRCYLARWSCYFYHSPLLSIRHLSQVTRRKYRNEIIALVLVQGTARKNTKEFHGGNPTGSAVKKNGREGIRGSGSSIRAVLKWDSLSTVENCHSKTQNKYWRMPCLSVENCMVLVRHKTHPRHVTQRVYQNWTVFRQSIEKFHGRWPQEYQNLGTTCLQYDVSDEVLEVTNDK